MSILRKLAPSLGLLAMLATTACGTSFVPAKEANPVLIEGVSDVSAVRAAVVRAMDARHFSPVNEGDGNIRARLRKGDATIEVAIEYGPGQYVVKYVTSSGLETQKGPGGELLVDARYEHWVQGLQKAIATELKRPGKERALAERRERDRELAIEQARAQQAQAEAARAQAEADQSAPPSPQPPPLPAGLPLPSVAPIELQHTTTVRHSEQSLTCCINGAKYDCPSQDAFNSCLTSGPTQCTPAGRCN